MSILFGNSRAVHVIRIGQDHKKALNSLDEHVPCFGLLIIDIEGSACVIKHRFELGKEPDCFWQWLK